MSTQDQARIQLLELLNDRIELLRLTRGVTAKEIVQFGTRYQQWYTKALKLVEFLAADRMDEFVGYYRPDPKRRMLGAETFAIQDFTKMNRPQPHAIRFDVHELVAIRLHNQFQILEALPSRINTIFPDVKGRLFSELQDAELEAASKLQNVNLRAAGALAGVVLERHLQRVVANHKIRISKKNPTVSDLNDTLKDKGVIDIPTWRKMQRLADLRNICAHQKSSDPTGAQVKELIAGVKSIIKLVF